MFLCPPQTFNGNAIYAQNQMECCRSLCCGGPVFNSNLILITVVTQLLADDVHTRILNDSANPLVSQIRKHINSPTKYFSDLEPFGI